MTRWRLGESEIDALIAERMLQRVTGDQADAEAWVDRARRTLATAAGVVDGDPESAFVLGYDAARHACTALLAQQGLRPTTRGGHLVVEQAMRAQFGESFAAFGALRRRRNQVEYPSFPGERMDADEARCADASECHRRGGSAAATGRRVLLGPRRRALPGAPRRQRPLDLV